MDKYAPRPTLEQLILSRLHPVHAEIYKLAIIGALPHAQVAKHLGISRTALIERVNRATEAAAIVSRMPDCDPMRAFRSIISKKDLHALITWLGCYSYTEAASKLEIEPHHIRKVVHRAIKVSPNHQVMTYLKLAVNHMDTLHASQPRPKPKQVRRKRKVTVEVPDVD